VTKTSLDLYLSRRNSAVGRKSEVPPSLPTVTTHHQHHPPPPTPPVTAKKWEREEAAATAAAAAGNQNRGGRGRERDLVCYCRRQPTSRRKPTSPPSWVNTLDLVTFSPSLTALHSDSAEVEEDNLVHHVESIRVVLPVRNAAAGGGRPPWLRRLPPVAAVPAPAILPLSCTFSLYDFL
jgi:hypothetical protein